MDWFEVVDRALKELVLAPENYITPVAYYISRSFFMMWTRYAHDALPDLLSIPIRALGDTFRPNNSLIHTANEWFIP